MFARLARPFARAQGATPSRGMATAAFPAAKSFVGTLFASSLAAYGVSEYIVTDERVADAQKWAREQITSKVAVKGEAFSTPDHGLHPAHWPWESDKWYKTYDHAAWVSRPKRIAGLRIGERGRNRAQRIELARSASCFYFRNRPDGAAKYPLEFCPRHLGQREADWSMKSIQSTVAPISDEILATLFHSDGLPAEWAISSTDSGLKSRLESPPACLPKTRQLDLWYSSGPQKIRDTAYCCW